MPRNPSGVFTKPFPDVISGTTVESAVHNGTVADFEADANLPRPIIAGGTGATTAAGARTAMAAERAGQQVTNYSSHVFENGSFWSDGAATAAPAAVGLTGVCVLINNSQNDMVLVAREHITGKAWTRTKVGGVWNAWLVDGAADYVNVTGDTMTGHLALPAGPAAANATRKDYVDAADALRVLKSGDTMTGNLVLPAGEPPADAATRKDYVQSIVVAGDAAEAASRTAADNLKVNRSGDTFTGAVGITTTDPALNFSRAADANVIQSNFSQTAGAHHWLWRWSDQGAQANFNIYRTPSGGGALTHAFGIDRSNGFATMPFRVSINGGAAIGTGYGILVGNGNVAPYAGQICCSFYSGSGYGGLYALNNTSGGGGNFMLMIRDDFVIQGSIQGTGAGTVYNTTSDARLKENVRDARGTMDVKKAIMGLRVVDFNWKGDKAKKREVGMLAQEVYEHLPQIVSPPTAIKMRDEKTGVETAAETPWSIDFSRAVPYLIDLLQQQQQQIDALETRLAALEKK
jgi:hypothetical protein